MVLFWKRRSNHVILLIFNGVAYSKEDTSRRAVWLGRHPTEKISVGPNDKLIQVGNLEWSVMAKAYLTEFLIVRNSELKDGHNDPLMIFNGSQF